MDNARRSDSSDENPRGMVAHNIGTTQGQARHLGRKWTTVVVKGCKRIGKWKRENKRIRVPASMWPCTIEEKLTLELVDGKEVGRYETKITDNEGFTTRYPGRCPQFMEDGAAVRLRPRGLCASIDQLEEEDRNRRSGFASRPLPQPEGNRNGWISEEKEHEKEEEVDSDLESTATSRFNPT